MSKLLVVDDEQSICWGLRRVGERLGHEVTTVSSAEEAFDRIDRQRPDVILLDVRLPGMDGLTALHRLRQRDSSVPVIIMTAFGDLQTAVEAVRQGAFEYLTKPFEVEKVQRAVQRALAEHARSAAPKLATEAGAMIGNSPAMQELFRQIALVAHSSANVLIYGESGTGKELAARAIHHYGAAGPGPFVPVNVAALSPTLAESELFGHARGAFTGADRPRDGLLVQAAGGVLFLDEVADIPLAVQVKLLRALEHGEILPVGSSQPVPARFRVVSATHQDLLAKVHEGTFRHDLYFRLCAFQLNIPPLRERREDIVSLAEHFLAIASAARGSVPTFSQAAIDELLRRPWLGNIRELRNAIDHAVVVARGGLIDAEHLPPAVAIGPADVQVDSADSHSTLITLLERWTREQLTGGVPSGELYERYVSALEVPFLKFVLEQHQGNFASAARTLGLHRTTLRKKLIDEPAGDAADEA